MSGFFRDIYQYKRTANTLACVHAMINIPARVFICIILITFQINESFRKVIVQNDVSGCVIFISNRIRCLDK